VNRRDFIKALSAAVASALVPSGTILAQVADDEVDRSSGFDPNRKYGDYVIVMDYSEEMLEYARRRIVEQAKQVVPRAYWHKVKIVYKGPGGPCSNPFDQLPTVGWKYVPAGKKG